MNQFLLLMDVQGFMQPMVLGIASLSIILLIILYSSYIDRIKINKTLAEVNQKLAAKNAENELLLKEVHHRVKNSLEIVSGMLELQAARIDSPSARALMLESQARVQSMGIVHKKLYQRENFTTIEMKDYFENLIESVKDTLSVSDLVEVECSMFALEMEVDTAVPLGLIANELLSNALKYAFDPKQAGKIEIGIIPVNGVEQYVFFVSDNGRGIKSNLKPLGTGFGSELINLLAKQLDGQLKYETSRGTKVSLYFKKKKHS